MTDLQCDPAGPRCSREKNASMNQQSSFRPRPGRQGRPGRRPHRPPPPPEDTTLHTENLQVERKVFSFVLKQNPRGRFLRITEEGGHRRETIIIPAPGLEEFRRMVDEMTRLADEFQPETSEG